jgi:1-deoxyxylulose-5-phosphate synthase
VGVYEVHRFDRGAPLEEIMAALGAVVRPGKARFIGASSMYVWQVAKAQHSAEINGWTKFRSIQNHYKLMYRGGGREMNPLCIDLAPRWFHGARSPGGVLSGNRTRDGERLTARAKDDRLADSLYGQDDFDVGDRLAEVAADAVFRRPK